MSGIYGMVRYDGAPVTRETLAPVASAMSFWGPDGHGQWCGEGAGLGHLMLHVTPESLRERLPASIRAAPHLVITADARIDNRDELFDALGVAGAGRDQTPDSSLILLAFERWGPDCIKRLLGDFAFAIWNTRERSLFCGRDLFGCKPFIYHYDGKRLVFASDVKGVLARVESPKLNEPLLAAYLQMQTYHAEKRLTFFEDVVKLPPAHTLTLKPGGLSLSRYWSPGNAPEIRCATDADYAGQMRFLLEQSVKCRLRSAFPVGSHLSGGLDSSSVTIVAARALRERGQQLEAFSWSPPPDPGASPDPADEHLRIDAVCRQEGLTCHYLPTTPQDYFRVCQTDFTVEPTEMMPREENIQNAAEALGIRAMLSGWGGDEAVSNAAKSALSDFFATGQWPEFWRLVRSRLKGDGPPRGSFPAALRRAKRLGGVLRDVAAPQMPDFLYFLLYKTYIERQSSCIQTDFARLHRRAVDDLRGPSLRYQPRIRTTIRQVLDYGHLTKRLEHWTWSGAAHRMVYRYPLLDARLVEFVLGIPPSQLCRFGSRLSVFRRATSGIMPDSCDWRRRKQESSAMASVRRGWFEAHGDWARAMADAVPDSPALRFVDPKKIQKALLTRGKSERMVSLAGVREALACYSIGRNRHL